MFIQRTGNARNIKKQDSSDIYKVPAPSRMKPVTTDDSGSSHLSTKQAVQSHCEDL